MQVQEDNKPYDDINITPMLDLAYVLLVIFIIMTTATVQGMKVNLPKASAALSLAQQTTKAITVANDGKIFLDTIPVTLPELEQRLVQQRALHEWLGRCHGSVQVVSVVTEPALEAVRRGRFLEDLYYRLCVVPVRVPSLRERPQDIEALAASAYGYANAPDYPSGDRDHIFGRMLESLGKEAAKEAGQ